MVRKATIVACRLRHIVFWLGLGSAIFASQSVAAQRLGAQRFRPAGSEDGVLGTEGADRRTRWQPYTALWLNYALRPTLLIDDATEDSRSPVEHVFAADLVSSIALWDGLEVGISVPVTFYSGGEDDPLQSGFGEAIGIGMGDLGLRAAYRTRIGTNSALAFHLPLLLPTSQAEDALAVGLGVKPTLAFTQFFGQRVEWLVNLSYLWREKATALDLEAGQEAEARTALRVALDGAKRHGALAEIAVSSSLRDFFSVAETPAEARIGSEHWLGETWRVSGFVGTGLTTGVGAPDFRVGIGLAYGHRRNHERLSTPTGTDGDGDSVSDLEDQCPELPEDLDGFEDQDGCPDPDNDRDGILDVDDSCPRAPGSPRPSGDRNGCPDRISLGKNRILTFEAVRFRFASDVIDAHSFPMLQEIANVLRANGKMRVRVEGHTDWVGDDNYNLDLSKRRARSVRVFLEGHGAKAHQLQSEGFGERRPIDSNETASGRSRNRRVEFHIL